MKVVPTTGQLGSSFWYGDKNHNSLSHNYNYDIEPGSPMDNHSFLARHKISHLYTSGGFLDHCLYGRLRETLLLYFLRSIYKLDLHRFLWQLIVVPWFLTWHIGSNVFVRAYESSSHRFPCSLFGIGTRLRELFGVLFLYLLLALGVLYTLLDIICDVGHSLWFGNQDHYDNIDDNVRVRTVLAFLSWSIPIWRFALGTYRDLRFSRNPLMITSLAFECR